MSKLLTYKFLKYNIQLLYVILMVLVLNSCSKEKNYSNINENSIVAASTFVGSENCKACHQEQFTGWKGSHHEQAMKIADENSVLGDFENTLFTYKNIKSKFFKKGNDYYVNTIGSDGEYTDFLIEYTFGVTPLQQYLIKFENGEYQCITTAWDSVKNEWYSLTQPDIDINHGDWLYWTGGAMSWNTMCADCHSTNVHKNYNTKTDTYNTTFSEINVSCESCHGPSSNHVDFYKNPGEKMSPPKMHMDSTLSSTELVDKCARCHSRRSQVTKYFDYEGEFMDHYAPSLLVDGLYELDGQISDEVYVYGSFIQSKMYHNGVSCRDCHDVHSLKLKKQGNDLCLSCHTPNYNEESHHFHPLNSEGSKCINCHMTGKMYMGNDFRRDHSFRIPRPDQSVKYDTQNACNSCHTDKSAEWASDVIVDKFGAERADHFSDHLLKGYFEDATAFEIVMANNNYPAIARATAISQFSNQIFNEQQLALLTSYLKDSSALVRNEVVTSLENLNHPSSVKKMEAMLQDSIRIVRISAARYFNMTSQDVTSITNFKEANKDFLTALNLNADFASGQHQIGLYYQAKGNIQSAIASYKRAVQIDGYYNRARMNLALLYYQQGMTSESEQLYLKVIEQEPEFGYSYYMLGLLYNELGDNQKALEFLGKSTQREPANQNAFYNYALKLQESKNYSASLKVLAEGLNLFPYNERLLHIKLLSELNLNLIDEARNTCQLLNQISPNNPNYAQLCQGLNQ